MALFHIDHVSEAVGMNLPLKVILPDPFSMGEVPVAQREVLYLLHGLSDDASAWARYSMIEVLARRYGLVVVMPTAGRSFYTDQPDGQKYFSYITEELPQYLQDVFGIQPQREKTCVAGLSMGGYGAIKCGLLRPGQYRAAASLSGVLSLSILGMDPDDKRKEGFRHLFGPLESLPGSEHDPAVWLQRGATHADSLPQLIVACGRQDDLYPLSLLFRDACQQLGVTCIYHEGEGRHDWPYWDAAIRLVLEDMYGPMPEGF